MRERKPAGYWKEQVPVIRKIYNEKGRRAVERHFDIDRHTLQKVCKRYGIDIKERRVPDTCDRAIAESNPKYQTWIKRRNEVMLMRW